MCNEFLVVIGIFASAVLIACFIYYSAVTIGWLMDLKVYTTNEFGNTIDIKSKLDSLENKSSTAPTWVWTTIDRLVLNNDELFQRVNQLEEKLNKRKGK